jgi:hypothetical protein
VRRDKPASGASLNLVIFFCGEMRCYGRVAQQRRSGKNHQVQADEIFHE